MQMKDSNKLDQRVIDKIIEVAYGDAGIFDWLYIRSKSLRNNEIKLLLEEYRQTADVVHQLKEEKVPEYITERTKHITGGKIKSESLTTKISFAIFSFLSNKAIPVAVFGILFIAIVSIFLFEEPISTHKYSKAEIELAQKQLKQSLAIVGRTFQKAERSFSKDVLNDQINKNLNRGYFLVNNILIGG